MESQTGREVRQDSALATARTSDNSQLSTQGQQTAQSHPLAFLLSCCGQKEISTSRVALHLLCQDVYLLTSERLKPAQGEWDKDFREFACGMTLRCEQTFQAI
jgi:hypothetical protein